MTPRTQKIEQDAGQGLALCAHLLGLLGGAALLFGVFVGSAQACLRLCERNEGWVKILGVGCAAVLIGAAMVEARHRRRRNGASVAERPGRDMP